MIVSFEQPFRILQADESCSILGYNEQELQGDTVLKLTGPETDRCAFLEAIESTRQRISSTSQFVLYDCDGAAIQIMVFFSPFFNQDLFVGCLMRFKRSEAISLRAVFEQSGCAYALACADAPHVIDVVNRKFAERFGCTFDQAHGVPLHNIQGPDHNSWTSMLLDASHGSIIRCKLTIQNPWCLTADTPQLNDIVCLPVVEKPNGKVRHFLILFPEDKPESPHAGPSSPATMLPLESLDTCSDSKEQLATIRPRRKGGADGAAATVVITQEVLDRVRDLPLTRAAEALGVSATSLQKACRKLGMKRWARSSSPSGCESPTGPPSGAASPIHAGAPGRYDHAAAATAAATGRLVDQQFSAAGAPGSHAWEVVPVPAGRCGPHGGALAPTPP